MNEHELLRLSENSEFSCDSFAKLVSIAREQIERHGYSKLEEYLDLSERNLRDLSRGKRKPQRVTILALECVIRRME